MISATNNFHEGSMHFPVRNTRPLSPTYQRTSMVETIQSINNHGVSLLRAGDSQGAMFKLSRCLAIMKAAAREGDKHVHYRFARSSRLIRNITTSEITSSSPKYVFDEPIEVIECPRDYDMHCCSCSSSNHTKQQTCKLLSIILFNLSLAHHLWALELNEMIRDEIQDKTRRNEECQEVISLLSKALRLYELCHDSLIFTSSGIFCSDLSIAVVVTNNVGEIHKEIDHQRNEQDTRYHLTRNQNNECSNIAIACSQQLVQIFMFFTANGESERLGYLGEVLSNAISTLNGLQVTAPAA